MIQLSVNLNKIALLRNSRQANSPHVLDYARMAIDNGVTGILCPTDDVEAFVAACRKLAADRELCGRFGKAGRKRAEEVFSEEKIVSQYIDLYQSLLKN